MTVLSLDDHNGIFYRYQPPRSGQGNTFVFFNALTGDTSMWEGCIGEMLRSAGHGTLSFNFRGQAESAFCADLALNAELIIDDCRRLLLELQPPRVILVGLSIGGLFAAQAWLRGVEDVAVEGLVLINTLRKDGPRLQWINAALVRCAEVGGLQLFRDLYAPLLFNEDWLHANRGQFLTPEPYAPLERSSGHYNLLRHSASADWDLSYEQLALPVLIITGLQDHVFLEAAAVEELSQRLPSARRIDMEDAAHILPAERPQACAEALLQFAAEDCR
ncbi:MAG: alpha/beta hydrolase [Motiliproteus sp.]